MKSKKKLNHPLMHNNITEDDRNILIDFLKSDPVLTNNKRVREFESAWSDWLGVKYSVFINSGSSANLLSMAALKIHKGSGEVIVPPLTWVSDIASVLQNGFKPVFVDIDEKSLAMDSQKIIDAITPDTKAVFLTHILGLDGLTDTLLAELEKRQIMLIEDVCESHGASHNGKKLGSFGQISNFSFYYAHHMSTIEGGMICTNDEELYETFRMLRSHGMVREAENESTKNKYYDENPSLNRDFIFAYPAYNVRSTELNAVLGIHQLKRLDENNLKRTRNFKIFLESLDSNIFRTDLKVEGSVNYAFILILKDQDQDACTKLEDGMRDLGIEFRKGTSGGGNQLRQPYLKDIVPAGFHKEFPNTEHVHNFGFYLGNFPDLSEEDSREIALSINGILRT